MTPPDAGDVSLLRVLQFAISPVVLISAVGLMLLTLTNRFGRAIDRSRELGRELDRVDPGLRGPYREQLLVMVRRARWLRLSISLTGASLLSSCLMIFLMFLKVIAGWPVEWAILGTFGLDILALIGAIVYFLMELALALKALEIEIGPYLA